MTEPTEDLAREKVPAEGGALPERVPSPEEPLEDDGTDPEPSPED